MEYDYSLNLTNQNTVLKDNLLISVEDYSAAANSTARVVKKVGNTVVLGATLNGDSQFLDFEATGANTVKHYAPTLVGNEIQKPLLVVDANTTGYVSNVRDLNESWFNYSYIATNKIYFSANVENEPFHLPMAVRLSSSTHIITTVKEESTVYGSSIDLIIPSSYTTIEDNALDYANYSLKSFTEYGSLKSICFEWDEGGAEEMIYNEREERDNPDQYVKSTNNNYFYAVQNWYSHDASTTCDNPPTIIHDGCKIVYGNISSAFYINFLYLPGSVITVDGYQLFSMCYPNFESIIIPSNVNTFATQGDIFEDYTQYGEGYKTLETITFSNSITSTFAEDVFAPLEGYLKTINFVGTKVEWNALKNIENAGIPSGVKINCLDGSFVIE